VKENIDHCFPKKSWDIVTTFQHTVHAICLHVFIEQGNDYDADDEQQVSGHMRLIGRGIPPLTIHTNPLAILERIPNGPDSGPNQNRKCMNALCPFPKLPTDSGELDEFFFDYACRGGKCPEARYKRPHINISCGIRNTPCSALNRFRDWLMIPTVKVWVRLTTQASIINGLRP